jgi:exopolysaccharide production protein ExoQ
LLLAGFVALIFFITDHGFQISLYEDYSGTSEYMETVTNAGNISRQIAMFALGIGGLFVLVRDRGYRLHIRSLSAVLIIAAAAWCAASWFWSIDPSIAGRRLISTGCVAVAALAAARMMKPRELAMAALLCTTGFLAIGILTEIALGSFHPWRPSYRFSGTLHPNLQGLNCALLVISAIYLAVQSTQFRVTLCTLAGTGLVGLFMSKSRTPLAALLVAETAFWFTVASPKKKLVAGLSAIFIACSAMLIFGDSATTQIVQSALLGRDDADEVGALTGRVPLWEELSDSIAQRPWQGYGYSSFWIPQHIEDISDSQQWAISVAHSAYLDLTLGVGFIGAGLAVAVVLWSLIRAVVLHVAAPNVGFGFIAVLLLFALVHGITESAFANPGFVPLVALSGIAMLAFVDPSDYADSEMT